MRGMKQTTKPKGKKDISIISDICMGECNDTWTSNIEDQLEDLKRIGEKLR